MVVEDDTDATCCGPGYASPSDAIAAPTEKLLYTVALYTGTGIQKPDYLATIDADPESPTYSQVIHRLEMPGIGDELHHTGWNACSSCHDDASMSRKYLLLPGVRSNNIYVVDTATDPKAPALHKIIDGDEIKEKANLSGHTPSTASVQRSLSRSSEMPRVKHLAATSTSPKSSRSLAAGRARWATSLTDTTSGISRVTTS